MKDADKTKAQLIAELRALRRDADETKQYKCFKTICDRAGYGVVIRDLSGHFVYVNDSFAHMHGYTSEDLIGKHYAIMHTPAQIKHVESFEPTRRKKGGFIAEIEHKRRDNTVFPTLMNGTLLTDENEKHVYNAATAIEITQLKNVEHELRRQIQRVELILETAMDGFLIIDRDGKILDMNNSASNIFGYLREEMVSANIRAFETDKAADGNVTQIRKIREKGAHRFVATYRGKDSHELHLECSANFVDMDEASFFFCFFRDITEKKKTEQMLGERDRELGRKNKHLEEANTALRVLLNRRDKDKEELEEKVLYNVKDLIAPVLARLKGSRLDTRQQTYVNILESNLNDIVSPFARRLLSSFNKLTPTEIQITNLIREGKSTKDIGSLMNLSVRTIEFHRKNIRKKLGLRNKKKNLRSHLLTIH
jgi:PAS domain S-box-containing protein